MASMIGLLVGFAVLFGPPLSVVALVIWAGRLRKSGAPHAIRVATYFLAAIVALLIIAGDAIAFFGASLPPYEGPIEPSQKARVLAATISEIMNSGAFALLVALGGYIALVLWSKRSRGAHASPSDAGTK